MTASRVRIIAISAAATIAVAAIAVTLFGPPASQDAPLLEGVLSIADDRHSPAFWLDKLPSSEVPLAEPASIHAQNQRLVELDPSLFDLDALPERLPQARVLSWITGLAERPDSTLYDVTGATLSEDQLDAVLENRNLDAIPARAPRQYGLVVRRADLRSFPTDLRVFRSADDTNIDRFQEDALFPGTPIVVAHESKDRNWWFVVSPRYAAWIRKEHVALGDATEVMAYSTRSPYRVVTGATVRTVFTPELPAVSELQLDMGVRVPLAGHWPLTEPVNGQNASGNFVIELPVRNDEGRLRLAPALIQANADTEPDYLSLTRGNIIRQGFKFLGERYGWGHAYNARDCSGFVSEVYRSMGVVLPRNTADQSVSPALDKTLFSEADGAEERMQAIRDLDVGDLVYIPGHVMMVIGFDDGEPWVIHDTTGATYFDANEQLVRVSLHAVSVTPLLPLRADEEKSYVDRMTSIVRVASASAGSQPPP